MLHFVKKLFVDFYVNKHSVTHIDLVKKDMLKKIFLEFLKIIFIFVYPIIVSK